MRLIVNGDDLGYSPAVNEAIFRLYENGRLNSTSLVVNFPSSSMAMERAKGKGGLAVGIHLNLTKGQPCLPPERISTLVNKKGFFFKTPFFIARAMALRIDQNEVEIELREQIERAKKAGIEIAHLNSHSHWQIIPQFRGILMRLAKEYQVDLIRVSDPLRTLVPNRWWLSRVNMINSPDTVSMETDYMLSLHHWFRKSSSPSVLFSG